MYKVPFSHSVDNRPEHLRARKPSPQKEWVQVPPQRLPAWIKVASTHGPNYARVRSILRDHSMHSVCQEAACPNIRECFNEGTATFMILGNRCTRGCNFCDVIKAKPHGLDEGEPARLANVVAKLKLKQVVITSVTRDDLPDGGASIFVRTIGALRQQDKKVKVEFLIPDFRGNMEALELVLESGVDVLAHNVETVGRLYKQVRPGMKLDRSLGILRFSSDYNPRPVVKTGFMVGLGETSDEVIELLQQVYAAGADIVTIGQYLRPSLYHLPVERFYHPDEFKELARIGREIGFAHVESGPLVRSSYQAFNQSRKLLEHTC
ncbi:MAG: lipoyl synthase [Candidatus Zixiibacteriota bacterium]